MVARAAGFKKIKRHLRYLLMHLDAVDGGVVAADVKNAAAVVVAHGQECVMANFSWKDCQLCPTD